MNVWDLPVDKNQNILKFCPYNIGAQRPMMYFKNPILSWQFPKTCYILKLQWQVLMVWMVRGFVVKDEGVQYSGWEGRKLAEKCSWLGWGDWEALKLVIRKWLSLIERVVVNWIRWLTSNSSYRYLAFDLWTVLLILIR